MSSDNIYAMVDPEIFAAVQEQIEKDSQVKEDIREALKIIDKEVRLTTSILSRVHIVPPEHGNSSPLHPYASYAQSLTGKSHRTNRHRRRRLRAPPPRHSRPRRHRQGLSLLQNVTFLVLFRGWLRRSYSPGNAENSLLTIEEVGGVLGIPVNLKTEDKFHLTIEEYLHAVLGLVEELTRLTTNAVTQRDFLRPQMINRFIKDIHSSFQVLNLKNDSLRRRGDGLKYNVKKVEEVNYDLILRNLIPTGTDEAAEKKEDVKESSEQQG
ncbi:Translin [Tuber indicum]|nr:Translin [Tuber indicum]